MRALSVTHVFNSHPNTPINVGEMFQFMNNPYYKSGWKYRKNEIILNTQNIETLIGHLCLQIEYNDIIL